MKNNVVLASWIGDVVGTMHRYGITQTELGAEMGVSNDYISMILNGKKKPNDIERRIREALKNCVKERCV